MDVCEEIATSNKCYKVEQKLLDNLYIEHHSTNRIVILWNKYQIFIYENNFETPTKIYVPEYQVHRIIITKNYLFCLDINGYVHVSTLKLKNPALKQLKCEFEPRDQGVITCVRFSQDQLLSLKYEFGAFTLCVNKISPNLQIEKKISIIPHQDLLPPTSQDKSILVHHITNEQNLQWLENILVPKQTFADSNNHLVVLSCDGLNVFACIMNPKSVENEIPIQTLCTCPSEISNINITDTHILIGLQMGTIMSFKIDERPTKPYIIHLNTALHKLSLLDEDLVYTDGDTMWRASNIFKDISFKQFFVKSVKDFTIYDGKILCTTFTKFIYTLAYNEDKTYINSCNEYLPAEKLISNTDYLNRIFQEVENSENLASKCTKEDLYITALSLSRRPDIINNFIQSFVTVYENYEELVKDNMKPTLTEEIGHYFEGKVYLFLIKITFEDVKEISALLKNIISDIDTMIYITVFSEQKIIKTTSIKIEESFTKANYLIPIQLNKPTNVNVNIKFVSLIPGAHDMNHSIWTVLYKNYILLNSECFIQIKNNSYNSLKDSKDTVEELIIKSCENQHGNQFNITEFSKHSTQHSMYVALPENFKQIFVNSEDYLNKYLCKSTANFIMQQFTSDEFLKSKSDISFTVGAELVRVQVENDGISSPHLKVSSNNYKLSLDMRNFLSNMFYGNNGHEQGVEFINNSFYTTVENIQKAVKSCITQNDFEEYLPLVDQFEKHVIGMLPV